MKSSALFYLAIAALFTFYLPARSQETPPLPLLPIPTTWQLEWQKSELAMFLHFGLNTFSDREWGDGTDDPALFNPTQLDARQWAQVAHETGFKTLILTAKHHDGFCLWPSRYTNYNVRSSPWHQGKGDVLEELARACKDFGLKMGLYLSPWDRHEASYGQGMAYNRYYTAQLQEIMSNYGPIHEAWFDGACGEGPNGKRQEYDFAVFWSLVRQLQPWAVIFSDEGPDVRWIGNEHGFAGETCWSMLDRSQVRIGQSNTQYLNVGDRTGLDWVPGECDVSIRKGWFYHPDQEPKSLQHLLDIYFKSVGRNCVLLLNVPPNRLGLIDEKDVVRLREFHGALREIFQQNLALNKNASSTATRATGSRFAPVLALDGDADSYWAASDSLTSATIEVDLERPVTFNIISLQEPIAKGQRVAKYRVEAQTNEEWRTLVRGTTIGYKKLDRIPQATTSRIRLVIEEARACPLISEIGLYFNTTHIK